MGRAGRHVGHVLAGNHQLAMGNRPFFVDLSSNNAHDGAASFDAVAYRKAGHRIVALKVSEGSTYVNEFWERWAKAAVDAGLSLVLYHFADPSDPAGQAVHFQREIKASRLYRHGKDRVFLDIEQGSNVADPVLFRGRFEATMLASGFPDLGVYSDAGYLDEYGPGLKPSGGDMWVAAFPTLPSGWWGTPWAHQYTETGRAQGVAGLVDLSRLHRSLFNRLVRRGLA